MGGADLRDYGSLQVGRKLGEGAQGKVLELDDEPELVYKEYFDHHNIDPTGLDRLVRWRCGLSTGEREGLDRRSAWLTSRVERSGLTIGVTMQRIPKHFMGTTLAGSTPQDLSYLLFSPRKAWDRINLPSDEQRIIIAAEIVKLIDTLHRESFILGDISMKNFLWTVNATPAVFLIDCDSVRKSGYRPPVPQLHTPDWDDPLVPSNAATLDSDRYKLAVAVIRILSRDAYVRPGAHLRFLPGIPSQIGDAVGALSSRAGQTVGTRPTAQEWLRALSGRPTITLSKVPRRPPSLGNGHQEASQEPVRPVIALKSYGNKQ